MKVTDKFTVVVEAVDHGEKVKLSSSTTVIINVQDGNNNLPTISRQTVGVTAAAAGPQFLQTTCSSVPNVQQGKTDL